MTGAGEALPVSACVMACDDGETLTRCLESLAFASEIIVVVDTKSRDQSEKIAAELFRAAMASTARKQADSARPDRRNAGSAEAEFPGGGAGFVAYAGSSPSG